MLRKLLLTFPLALLLVPVVASAAEGVHQINQACVADGCFEGDTPGWPVLITQPGSYRLTSNLDLRDAPVPGEAKAIQVQIDSSLPNLMFDIDLNGFSIFGPVTCTGFPVTACDGDSGGGFGIQTTSAARIHDGMVHGFRTGVSCFSNCIVERVVARRNAGVGIYTTNNASLVIDSIAHDNLDAGIWATGRVRGSAVEDNGQEGLFLNPNTSADGNVIRDNGGNGVRCASCLLTNNTIANNGGFGVTFSGSSSWQGNAVYGNATNVDGSALQLGANRCGGALCP